ncbi:MAG: hypothetical protein CSA74_03070 [Rhodobacterales bacterium]|nr:MAG: hypothetical protein CSA74_03070 [Rhodobacterales bacterium]
MKHFAVAACLCLLLAVPSTGFAESGPHAEVSILPGWRQADGHHMAALKIDLDSGWKTYWRAPGEAGIPPRIDWVGSENLAGVWAHWPVPEIITSNGVTTLGFAGELVLPFEVRPVDREADIPLEVWLAFGICKEVCTPLHVELSAVLPADSKAQNPRILGALAARPDTAEEAAVAGAACAIEEIADGLRLTARLDMPPVGAEEFVAVEAEDPTIWISEAVVRREQNVLIAEADLVPPQAKPFPLDPQTLRFTVIAGGRGVDIRGCSVAR